MIPHGKGQFWWIGAPIVKYRIGTIPVMPNNWTDPFAISVVDSSGPKDAQVQSYSPGGVNVPLRKDTLPFPVE